MEPAFNFKLNICNVSNKNNNRRLAVNSLFLYLRMIFLILVQLYTVPIILNALGVEDYGIYNVVGGIVTMFSFIGGALASGSQRFLAYWQVLNRSAKI